MRLDDFGRLIKAARKEKKLKAETVARRAGVDPSLLSRLENGRLPELGATKLEAILNNVGLELSVRPYSSRPTLYDMRHDNDQ